MPEVDFTLVLDELDSLETEIDAVRVAVDEGETFHEVPSARQAMLGHLGLALQHAINAARSLIDRADWEEPEEGLDAIQILVDEEVLPRRVGATIMDLADTVAELEDGSAYQTADDPVTFEQLTEGLDALTEYQEYVHQFLKEWSA